MVTSSRSLEVRLRIARRTNEVLDRLLAWRCAPQASELLNCSRLAGEFLALGTEQVAAP